MPVFVLGMHRSGTSAITRCINLMGLSIGRQDDLLPADQFNERGYWENASLVRINDEIFSAGGGTWFAPPAWADNWPEDEHLAGLRDRAAEALKTAFPEPEWVWKDPRNCLTFPFWRRVVLSPPCVVFVWRDPTETRLSLERVHHLEPYLGALLWTLYNRAALAGAAGLPTFALSFAALLNDPWGVLERLRTFLAGLGMKVTDAVPWEEVRSFLDPSLRHHRKADVFASRAEPAAFAEQRAMLDYLGRLPESHASLSVAGLPAEPAFCRDILASYNRYCQVNALLVEAQHTITKLDGVASQNAEARKALDKIHQSRTWRALKVGRKFERYCLEEGERALRLARKSPMAMRLLLTDPREFVVRVGRWWARRSFARSYGGSEHSCCRGFSGDTYAAWLAKHHPPIDPEAARRRIQALAWRPKFSIIMPTYNTPPDYLRAAVESVRRQLYENWELCIADDGSVRDSIPPMLHDYLARDKRIRVRFLEKNLGIAGASNAALAMASGDFVGLLDHDDELDEAALLEAAVVLNEHPETDMIYSDEDKLDLAGRRCDPFFKPDWSPTTFLSYMYTCHLGIYRRSILSRIGGFREGLDGSQDYDLVLRFTELTDRIRHIPKLLYHWRMTPQSTALSLANKPYAERAGCRAIADAMHRRGQAVREVKVGRLPTTYRVRYRLPEGEVVHIIIPSRNNVSYLRRCLRSVFKKTEYPHHRVHVVDNGSDDPATLAYLRKIGNDRRVQVLRYDQPFNFSAINNWAVRKIDGRYLLLLNDDTEVITPDWLEAMLEQAQRSEVGAVGAKLIYPDGRIQHGGVVLGVGVAYHAHRYFPAGHSGYYSRLEIVQNFSAVTAACLMTRREVYEQIGGLNETALAVGYNDVDFCLRLRQAGYEIVYTPFAELYHHESVSRGPKLDGREVAHMRQEWGDLLLRDPFYNPNFEPCGGDFTPRA